jgi:uncharacterized repeat protein (TIGR02059 family)
MKKLFILILLAISSVAYSTTFYIDPAGSNSNFGTLSSPWKTLAYACSRVTAPGDIIHVNAGLYIETTQSELAVGVSIEGDGITSIIRSQVTGDWSPTISLTSSVVNTNGNQHISNIKMEGSSQTAWGAIYVAARGNVRIHHCTFVDFKYTAVIFNGKVNMYDPAEATAWCKGNEFYNNTITSCAASYPNDYQAGALHIGAQEGMLIYNNTITETSRPTLYNGYCIKYFNNGFNRGVKIYSNTLTKAPAGDNSMDWNFAIELWNWRGGMEIYDNVIFGGIDVLGGSSKGPYAFQADIHHNTIGYTSLQVHNTAATNGGIYIEEDNTGPLYIHHNLFRNIGTPIQVYPDFGTHTNNTYIYDNIFSNIGTATGNGWSVLMACASSPREDGITTNPTIDNFNFINNTVYAGTGTGRADNGLQLPDMGNATNITVRNNIFHGFKYNPVFSDIKPGRSIDYLSIENNIFYANGTNAVSHSIAPTHNTTQNNIVANPLYVSTSDFHLQAGSPAIGAGITVSSVTIDYDGNAFNNPRSIGAYEFGSTPPPPAVPVYVSSVIQNTTPTILQMTYSLALANIIPPTSSFTVLVNGATRTVSSVAISSDKVNLTLSTRVNPGDIVTISYTPSTNPIQTPTGGQAIAISTQAVTNNCVNTKPSVIISSPGNGSTYTAPATITITATATDNDGTITKVEFFSGSTKIGEKLTAPYTFTWNSVDVGTYALTATATDNLNGSTTSAVISVVVNTGAPPANIPPVVSISSPLNNAVYTAPAVITITANATDSDGTISKVEFYNGAIKLGEKTSSPYSYTWNNVPAGTYSLTVIATDNLFATTTSAAISVTINPGTTVNQPPIIEITSPAKDAVFITPTNLTILATTSDPDGYITKVEFYNGVTLLAVKNSPPYTYTWINVDPGYYLLTAVSTDNLNAKTTSTVVPVRVRLPNVPPVVNISLPGDNTIYGAPAAVIITADAYDSDGNISKIEFFSGDEKIGERYSTPYSLIWSNVGEGSYTLKAIATDDLNATSASSDVTINVVSTSADFFNLYPNPGNGLFYISLITPMQDEENIVKIIDSSGKTIFRGKILKNESIKQFDITAHENGVYILMIMSKEIVATKRLIKN